MKKRMFLSTILMTLVLLVAVTTATFAWYSAAQGAANLTSSDQASVAAKTETVELGSVTFTVSFDGVTDAFDGVDLTDESGKSYYWTGSKSVEYTAAKAYGTASATVTASVAEGEDLEDALVNLVGAGKTVTLVITASGQVIVAEKVEDVHKGDVANYIEFSLELAADGKTKTWTKSFVYSVRTNNPNGAEVEHTADSIKATLK